MGSMEVFKMETDFKEKYDSALRDKLQELRDEFEEEASNIRLEVENSYKLKVLLRSTFRSIFSIFVKFFVFSPDW